MKELDQIREEVYQKKGYSMHKDIDLVVDEVAKLFALEVSKEALRNAANNAETEDYPDPDHGGYGQANYFTRINKESILSETNIPKL